MCISGFNWRFVFYSGLSKLVLICNQPQSADIPLPISITVIDKVSPPDKSVWHKQARENVRNN